MTDQANKPIVDIYAIPEKLVMANSEQIRHELERLIKRGSQRLILDLSQVEQMDSSGLAVLVATWRLLKTEAGDVVLLSPRPSVRALLDLTRMHELFGIYEDLDAAQSQLAA